MMKEDTTVHLLGSTTNSTSGLREPAHGEVDIDRTLCSSITPMLVFATFIAVLGSLSIGSTVGYTSTVQYEIMKELDLSTAEYSLFGSMSLIGGIIGSLVCGKITDYLGRKRVLGLDAIFFIFGWFAISIGQGVWLLNIGRWMTGFSTGISAYIVPIYIAEFSPKNLRGGFVIVSELMSVAGVSMTNLIGLVVSWRTLALIAIIPSIVQIVGLFFIPESPRWLIMINKEKEFEAALQRFRGDSADISQEAANIKDSVEALQHLSKVNITQLLQKRYAYTLTVGIGLSALCMLVGTRGITLYSFSIFESAGFSGKLGVMAMSLIQLPSMPLAITLPDQYGRRPLLMISTSALCLGCLLVAISFLLQDYHLLKGFSSYLALIGILIFSTSYPGGLGGVTPLITSEIYPLNIKGLAGSASALVYNSAGLLVAYAFNFSMEWSSSGTFFIFAGICVITLIFVAKLVPETKGRTLEEIHMSMGSQWN